MTSKVSSQMLKGILSGCILVLLSRETLYGYKISTALMAFGFDEVPMGTIYPLLLSLEKKGFIQSQLQPSENGPDRKYYTLTAAGKAEKKAFIKQWQVLSTNVAQLIKEDVYEDLSGDRTK